MRRRPDRPSAVGGLLFIEGNRRYEIDGALQDGVAEGFALVVGFYSEVSRPANVVK